ncbi:hypothetical protein [Azohydromonas caseinilytica]|uniref:Uncharacterized protein n=1 Tax=Azohydromonas caseinilytica TaxID=2728836 RepID=A0A848F9V8_9BURK|nr:hypothetical protein [Azohydromonas caseinilytica]NML15103.1 hypothetical protein [Azohydromonas caseinilytica]
MSVTLLYSPQTPVCSHWQLGNLQESLALVSLIGWAQYPPPVDAGVPDPVAAALAEALTVVGQVVFPWALSEGAIAGVIHAQRLTPPGWGTSLIFRLKHFPCDTALLFTRDPQAAQHLFHSVGFPWTQQGQIVLVLNTQAAFPALGMEQIDKLTSEYWATQVATLKIHGIVAALRPGVDGDVAAFLALNEDVAAIFQQALQASCVKCNVNFELCTETELANRLSENPNP